MTLENTHVFEGPEKRLEVDFKPIANGQSVKPLRSITQDRWQTLLDTVNCTILSKTSNANIDSYVLSESSLFVYDDRIVLKTCGTTTLLRCLNILLEYAKECELEVKFVLFSRRNFLFPQRQKFPHCAFENEINTLQGYFQNRGHAYILGPVNGAHWHVYVADFSLEGDKDSDQHVEIMMTDLDPKVMNQYYRPAGFNGENKAEHRKVTVETGIDSLFPGGTTDEFLFEPCGYSMNSLRKNAYATVHITPEPGFSFVSYETNYRGTAPEYQALVEDTIRLFNPGVITVVVFADAKAVLGSSDRAITKVEGYDLEYHTTYELRSRRNVTAYNFIRQDVAQC